MLSKPTSGSRPTPCVGTDDSRRDLFGDRAGKDCSRHTRDHTLTERMPTAHTLRVARIGVQDGWAAVRRRAGSNPAPRGPLVNRAPHRAESSAAGVDGDPDICKMA
jgi:hypothetical protein